MAAIRNKGFSRENIGSSRNDPDVAARVLREQLPDPEQRRRFEVLLADLIERAHGHGSASWSLTLKGACLRLNVGAQMVLDVVRGKPGFWGLGAGLSEEVRARISAHPRSYESGKRFEDAVGFKGPPEIFFDLLPEVELSLHALVDAAAERFRGAPFRRSHSPGVSAYLRRELGREVPDAQYHEEVPTGSRDGAGYSWIPLYRELAERLLDYRDDRAPLLALLASLRAGGMKVVSLEDREAEGDATIPLADIDPFTFFSSFNRGIRDEGRQAILGAIAEELELESPIPADFEGIPIVQNLSSWFFAYANRRDEGDIDRLWSLAEQAITGGRAGVDGVLFDRVLEQLGVGIAQLTAGLYWMRPDEFLPVDGNTMAQVEAYGLGAKPGSYEEYLGLISRVVERLGADFPAISFEAWADGVGARDRRRFWAGGTHWGGTSSQLERFLAESRWQMGWSRDSAEPAARRAWMRFQQIRPGDLLAIKGIGGRNDLVVHAIAEVRRKDEPSGALELQILRRDGYHGKAPTGAGAGAWRDTLLELTRKDAILQIFGTFAGSEDGTNGGDGTDGGGKRPTATAFDDVLAHLEARHLQFPIELVASYLLALQTKRFVILTGISGTGKTQLALEVAKLLGRGEQKKVLARAGTKDDPNVRAVVPSFLKRMGMIIPRAFEDAEADFMEHARKQQRFPLRFLDEPKDWEIRVGRAGEATKGPPYFALSRKHADAVRAALKVGDLIRIDVEEDPRHTYQVRITKVGDEGEVRQQRHRHVVVAVRPDWTDHRGLLGYLNPLTERYHVTPFLRTLLEAAEEAGRAEEAGESAAPYFAVLDEMNLARVEHYFSDFLSCLESGEPLVLHERESIEDEESGLEIPGRLEIPSNLFFTGTVNVDETTYMFSPKVLDRAFVLEFNSVDLASFSPRDAVGDASLRLVELPLPLACAEPPAATHWQRIGTNGWDEARDRLLELHDILTPEHRHFGYRVANEIGRFLDLAHEQAGDGAAVMWTALDVALMAKVLPKLHGTQQELDGMLRKIFAFAVGDSAPDEELLSLARWRLHGSFLADGGDPRRAVRFPRTAAKLWRMRRRLEQQGFTSFVE